MKLFISVLLVALGFVQLAYANNPIPVSNIRPTVSNTRPPVKNTRPPISNTRPSISNTRPPQRPVPISRLPPVPVTKIPFSPKLINQSDPIDTILKSLNSRTIEKLLSYKPYPAPKLWAKDPLYYQAVNNGTFDKQVIDGTAFDRNVHSNFGIRTYSRSSLISLNDDMLRLRITRTRCPRDFYAKYLRKANQMRQRHQAGPLRFSRRLSFQAHRELYKMKTIISHNRTFHITPKTGPGRSLYIYRLLTETLNNVNVPVEDPLMYDFYKPAFYYHNYGKQSKVPKSDRTQDFLNLINANSNKIGIGCLVIQSGVGVPVEKIFNHIFILFLYNGNQKGANYKDNIYPPGYFYWDKGLNVSTHESEDIKRDSSLDSLDAALLK